MGKYVIALDQGTTSSRAIIFDKQQSIVATAQKDFRQIYPKPGYVEHDPMEIYSSQLGVLSEVIARTNISPKEIAAIGITNQRETTILWDRRTGLPVYNAIVWQCRRTSSICENLKVKGFAPYIRQSTGLIVDAYFSATKIKWILDNVPEVRQKAENGDVLFGTVDSWLIWKMTGGQAHVTDYTNASRTMLYNINTLQWDGAILKELDIPEKMLPKVVSSSEVYGHYNLFGEMIPIAGAAGDQHAALFGQNCFNKGDAKNTYGTGCFLLMNTGDKIFRSHNGLISTIAIGIGDKVQYALEGSVFVGGAVIQWLRDELRFVSEAQDSEYYALKVRDNGGVYVVPAFTGLGAPHWDMYARGAIFGLTRGTKRNHIIRAALESIAYQTKDVLDAMEADTGISFKSLKVDGGASANNFLMQFQADILQKDTIRPKIRETTALGAASLAGLAVGFWNSKREIERLSLIERTFNPNMRSETRSTYIKGWNKAVGRTKFWIDGE